MCLNLGATILYSITEIQLVLCPQCNVGAPVWSDKACMQCQITLVFLEVFYMHLISPSMDSEATYLVISVIYIKQKHQEEYA